MRKSMKYLTKFLLKSKNQWTLTEELFNYFTKIKHIFFLNKFLKRKCKKSFFFKKQNWPMTHFVSNISTECYIKSGPYDLSHKLIKSGPYYLNHKSIKSEPYDLSQKLIKS